MKSRAFLAALVAGVAHFVHPAAAANYTLKTDLSYNNFFQNFDFFTGPDPTHGFVQYQPLESAMKNEYIGYFNDTKSVYLGADYKTKDPKGRASIRVSSKAKFNHGLLIADIAHMPSSECGVWPAFWMLGDETWPRGGEIDILEGVNDYDHNAVTLHTSAGCAVDNKTAAGAGDADGQQAFSGSMATSNCDVAAAGQEKNVGCSVKAPSPSPNSTAPGLPSYGTPFNANGGGVYALEWTSSHIAAWFFPRNASSSAFPDEDQLTQHPDPASWGVPLARFQGRGCDFGTRFRDMRIIFNTAFCGDWAGTEPVWAESCRARTGVATCEEYVREHPGRFEEAYWELLGLRWFEET